MGLGGDVRLDGLAHRAGVGDDLRGLGLGVGQLLVVLSQHALAFDLSFLRLLQGLADGVLSLLQHAGKHRPAELSENDPEDDEGDEHGDELRHVRQDGGDAALLFRLSSERERRESSVESQGGEGDLRNCFVRSCLHVQFLLPAL